MPSLIAEYDAYMKVAKEAIIGLLGVKVELNKRKGVGDRVDRDGRLMHKVEEALHAVKQSHYECLQMYNVLVAEDDDE